MRPRSRITSCLLPLVLRSACADDPLPAGPEGEHSHGESEATKDLGVQLEVSPDHVPSPSVALKVASHFEEDRDDAFLVEWAVGF